MRAEEFLLDGFPSWMDRGACTEDPERFMDAPVRDKKAVCRRCPVRQDCLTYALEQGEDRGVWGGRDSGRRPLRSRVATLLLHLAHVGT